MEKYQNKYRIASARASWWDYSWNASYFITVCSANRECLFGQIVGDELVASPIGQIVLSEWYKSFEIRSELFYDTFVLMPNHLHAILRIDNNRETQGDKMIETHGNKMIDTHGDKMIETHGDKMIETHGRASVLPYRSPKSISSFMAGFKSSATKLINEYRQTPKMPVWQSRFHDHIIRNDAEYQRIFDYIKNNPANWKGDKFHSL